MSSTTRIPVVAAFVVRAGSSPQRLLLGLSCLLAFFSSTGIGADEVSKEDKIKAAIVYKLGKFVEWPAASFTGAAAPLVVCLTRRDPIAEILSKVTDRTVKGHPIKTRIVSPMEISEAGCHILYIPSPGSDPALSALETLANTAVLTVSDRPKFAMSGGMIGLVRTARRYKFQINPLVAQRAGLTISAPLMSVAEIVE